MCDGHINGIGKGTRRAPQKEFASDMLTSVLFMLFADLRKKMLQSDTQKGYSVISEMPFIVTKGMETDAKTKCKRMTVYHVCINPHCIKDMFIELQNKCYEVHRFLTVKKYSVQ
jgi:hypothetical protein